jgi:hypothetical protein
MTNMQLIKHIFIDYKTGVIMKLINTITQEIPHAILRIGIDVIGGQ